MSKRREKRYRMFFAAVLVFFTACQPTPEAEVVTNKGDAVAEKKVFSTAEPGVGKSV